MSSSTEQRAADERELVELVRRALTLADRLEHWLVSAHLDRALVGLGEEPPAFELR